MKKWTVACILTGLVIWGILVLFHTVAKIVPTTSDNSVVGQIEGINEVSTSNIKEDLDTYLNKLAKVENCPIVEGIIDTNKKVSKGKFCFQKTTYLYFVKRYELYPYAEENELLSNWGDSWTQEEIVKNIIKEDKNLLAVHWVNSIKKIGLPK